MYQPHCHSRYGFALRLYIFIILCIYISNFMGNDCLSQHFSGGALRNIEESYRLFVTSVLISFCQITWDRYSGPANLIPQTVVFTKLSSRCELVNINSQIFRSLPHLQILKITHNQFNLSLFALYLMPFAFSLFIQLRLLDYIGGFNITNVCCRL